MTALPPSRRIALAGIHNLRDLGGHAHPDGELAWGRFWRSDSPHDLDGAGADSLIERGLVTIIDLREPEEAAQQPNPLAGRIAYHSVPIFGGLDLSLPAIVDAEDPLLALYCVALAESAAAFARVMRLIAAAPAGTILFHCTAGKDRTGLVAALLLKLAGVADADIVADYAETACHIGPVLAALEMRARARGADVARLSRYWGSDAVTMQRLLEHLETRHGGVVAYLSAAGLTAAELRSLRLRLGQTAVSASSELPLSAQP